MNKLLEWTSSDTIYIIIACVVSLSFVAIVLSAYNNIFIKLIFFGVITTLLFFLLKYLHEANMLFADQNKTKWNNMVSKNVVEKYENEYENKNNQPNNTGTYFLSPTMDDTATAEEIISNDEGGSQYPSDNTTGEEGGSQYPSDNTTGEEGGSQYPSDNTTGEEGGSQYPSDNTTGEEGGSHYPSDNTTGEEGSSQYPSDNTTGEEGGSQYPSDNTTGEEEHPYIDHKKTVVEEEDDHSKPDINKHTGVHPNNRSKDVPNYKPYQSPVNITVSYNTKNSVTDSNFAKDDVISNNQLETFTRPDYNSRAFHDNIPDKSAGINYLNQKLNSEDPNNNYYRPSNTNCPGSRCDPRPILPQYHDNHNNRKHNKKHNKKHNNKHNKKQNNKHNKNHNNDGNPYEPDLYKPYMYSGSGFSYVEPGYQNYPSPSEPRGCPSGESNVCPLEINQNWSKWKPEYLSGDDIHDKK